MPKSFETPGSSKNKETSTAEKLSGNTAPSIEETPNEEELSDNTTEGTSLRNSVEQTPPPIETPPEISQEPEEEPDPIKEKKPSKVKKPRHSHNHGHSHGNESTEAVSATYMPEELMPRWKRLSYLTGGLTLGTVSAALWALDFIVHLSPIPFDDIVVHGAAIAVTAPALRLLNKAWRGYQIPENIRTAPRNTYEGDGFPIAAATYAMENLQGYYKEGASKTIMSAAVLASTLFGHAVTNSWNSVTAGVSTILHQEKTGFSWWPAEYFYKAAAILGGLVPLAIHGFGKGMNKWRKEALVDGFKRKKKETADTQ